MVRQDEFISGAEDFSDVHRLRRDMCGFTSSRESLTCSSVSEWRSLVEKSFGRSVKCFRTDNGGEFTSDEFEGYLKDNGIKHELTIPKSPQQNGVAERMNRTLSWRWSDACWLMLRYQRPSGQKLFLPPVTSETEALPKQFLDRPHTKPYTETNLPWDTSECLDVQLTLI